jgi:hypothetical protein
MTRPGQPILSRLDYADCFLPTVYINDSLEKKEPRPFKLVVFLGLKTMVVLFLRNDYRINLKMLAQLNVHLSKQVPILSQLLDEVLSKP